MPLRVNLSASVWRMPSGTAQGNAGRVATETEASRLSDFVARSERLLVLTGAGCSTQSGIPDYRDSDGRWKRGGRPVMYQDFVADEDVRRRYWARAVVGWQRMREAQPNDAHVALAALESAGFVDRLITQNVDGLHHKAGSRRVIDLHGRVDMVCCLRCGRRQARDDIQAELARRNPAFVGLDALAAPDGDADLEGVDFSGFDVPDCAACDGLLKPDVVFFGESVPRERVSAAMAAADAADALLVVGSSLMVWSGFRFAKRMSDDGKPVAALNVGRTRADELLALKVSAPCAEALRSLASSMLAPDRSDDSADRARDRES